MRVQGCSSWGHLQLILIVCFVMHFLAELSSVIQLIERLLKPSAVSAAECVSACSAVNFM